MLEYDFENSIGYWVCMTSHLYEQALNEELTPRGITYRQFQVLGWLAFEGGLSQAELAEKMRIEPPTLVKILDCMQRDGLISREPCPHDRRRNVIRPQAKVRPVWSKMVACARRVRERAVAGLDAEQVKTLKELLGAVQENLRAARSVHVAARHKDSGRNGRSSRRGDAAQNGSHRRTASRSSAASKAQVAS